jgi:peptide/nickel transport system substrate-binding protein
MSIKGFMKNIISFFFLVIVFSLNAFSAAAKPTELKIAIIQEWSAFNPINSQLASNQALFPFFLRQMVLRTAKGGVVPDVAESVSALKKENGKFKATWKIRNNAKWGDGADLTCADWHLAWKAGLNPKVSVETRSSYSKIENIEWNPKTPKVCVATYTTDDWTYDRDLPPLIPSHLEKAVMDKFGNEPEGYDRNSLYISQPTNPGLFNGPYVVTEFKLGSHFILSVNPHFYGKKPQISRVIVKLITDTSALKANLASGQINGISAVGFPPDTAIMMDEEFKKSGADFTVHFVSSGIFQGIYFNLEKDLFKNIKVREALSSAIDKESIVKAFFNSHLDPADGILSPQHPAFKKPAPIYSISKANKILDEDGWKLNASGVREKNGVPLTFTFKTSAGLKVLENIQVYVCERFKSIGALCNIKNEPPRALLGQSVPHGEYDLAMYGQPLPIDASISSYFNSNEIPNAKNSWAGGNQIRLSSKEVDKMLSDFDKEHSAKKRNEIISKLDEYFRKNFLMIPLYHRREAVVLPKNLKGVEDSYEGTAFTSPENWNFN